MPDRPVVMATRRLPDRVEAIFGREFQFVPNRSDRPFDQAELARALQAADGLVPCVADRLPAALFSAGPIRTKILANFGVGVNHIDVGGAHRRGVVVTNTPGVVTECTADLTLLLILMVMRGAGRAERRLRSGRWSGWAPMDQLGVSVSGKTLGIVGFGRIGRAVATRAAQGFGMRVLFWTPRPPDPATYQETGAAPRADLSELLAESDVVSLHCPGTLSTHHLINGSRLRTMRPGAFLINTARGSVVDEAALVSALRENHLAGAGLDVYEQEPNLTPGLLELDNVVLLPHVGSATIETREAMGMKAVENVRAFFRGDPVPDPV